MRVLASPGPGGGRDDNPYLRLLYGAVADSGDRVEVSAFTRAGLLGKPDVIHVHWPEFLVRWDRLRTAVPDVVKVLALLTIARRRGAAIVWTGHNLQPHAVPRPWLWRVFFGQFCQRVDLLIVLSEGTRTALLERYPALRTTPFRVVPHGHYRGEYPDPPDRTAARRALGLDEVPTLLAFGLVAPYKRTPELLEAFRQRSATRPGQLLIAGKPSSPALAEDLGRAAGPDVSLFLQRIPHDEVPTYFAACDVVVLPYSGSSALNSGVALLALSFGRPVVMVDGPAARELRTVAGDDWVILTDADMASVVDAAMQVAERPPAAGPDLSSLDWPALGALTVDAYRTASALRRPAAAGDPAPVH